MTWIVPVCKQFHGTQYIRSSFFNFVTLNHNYCNKWPPILRFLGNPWSLRMWFLTTVQYQRCLNAVKCIECTWVIECQITKGCCSSNTKNSQIYSMRRLSWKPHIQKILAKLGKFWPIYEVSKLCKLAEKWHFGISFIFGLFPSKCTSHQLLTNVTYWDYPIE